MRAYITNYFFIDLYGFRGRHQLTNALTVVIQIMCVAIRDSGSYGTTWINVSLHQT